MDFAALDTSVISVEYAAKIMAYVKADLQKKYDEAPEGYTVIPRNDQIPILKWMVENNASAQKAKSHFKLDSGLSTIARWKKLYDIIAYFRMSRQIILELKSQSCGILL
jgi:phage FluMu gp28-like protein